jgi:Cof subfamily protein (haloacid dehalogenase superfamily)
MSTLPTPYKVIAVDLDGTLLNNDSQISDETVYWLKRAQEAGFTICFATGRGRKGAYAYMEQLGLPGPFVLVNGSEIWLSKDQLHRRHVMPFEDVCFLQELAIEAGVWYWGYSTDGVHNSKNWHPQPLDAIWLKFGFMSDDPDLLDRIQQRAAETGRFEITNSDVDNLEMNPKGISKASGLEEVCALLQINMDQIVAFGDSRNDLAMIQSVGMGVAMGNAQESVKQVAKFVALTNEQNGIAAFIQQHLLA